VFFPLLERESRKGDQERERRKGEEERRGGKERRKREEETRGGKERRKREEEKEGFVRLLGYSAKKFHVPCGLCLGKKVVQSHLQIQLFQLCLVFGNIYCLWVKKHFLSLEKDKMGN
jgi:hypothetical protein